jgi:xylan 1,4-beta-xylosidase
MNPRSVPVTLEPQWRAAGSPLRHSWAGHLNIDQFRWLVRADLQQHLSLARAEIGGRHVRAVGMFDDELRVLRPGPESYGRPAPKPRLNWQVVDAAIDALLARGLRPVFTTTFVPSVLASGTTTVFTTQGVTSPPRDYAAWGRLVEAAVRHQIERHGLTEVRRWYFEVWNEPNLKGWFWDGDQADFFHLWQFTHRAIKRVDRQLRVGGPSTGRAEWLEEFLAFGRARRCPPDYLALHIYNNDGAAGALAPFDSARRSRTAHAAELAVSVIRERTARARELGFKGEIHWNEWGRSWLPCEPERETPLEAVFHCPHSLGDLPDCRGVFVLVFIRHLRPGRLRARDLSWQLRSAQPPGPAQTRLPRLSTPRAPGTPGDCRCPLPEESMSWPPARLTGGSCSSRSTRILTPLPGVSGSGSNSRKTEFRATFV